MSGNTFRHFGGEPVTFLRGEDGRHDVSCFADEVVIDFPSVAVAIERMRRAFVADERPPRQSCSRGSSRDGVRQD